MNTFRGFQPHPWLGHRHLQTVAGTLARPAVTRTVERDWIPSAYGDRLLLERLPAAPGAPRVLILHGMSGSSRAPVVRYAMAQANLAGFEAIGLNLRGSELCPATIPRLYHAGSSDDLEAVVRGLLPGPALLLGGFSLGANILLKWLGERAEDVPGQVLGACAVCSPLDLAGCASQLEQDPVSRLYRWHLVGRLKRLAAELNRTFPGILSEVRLRQAKTFRDFDEHVTAKLHGFAGADDYWSRCSSLGFLAGIRRPTLLINARDDPFLARGVLEQVPRTPWLETEFPDSGGHLGFVGPGWQPWVEQRMVAFFVQTLRRA